MAASVFIDTNVLLRFTLFGRLKDPKDEIACRDYINRHIELRTKLWISGQVIREFCVQATNRKTLLNPLTSKEAAYMAASFPRFFQIADETPAVRTKFIELLDNHDVPSIQIHDANIAATVMAYGINTLCTTNQKDFRRYREITLEAPLANPA